MEVGSGGSGICMDEKPRLVEASSASRHPANVLVVFGFSWHTSEAQVREYLLQLCPHTAPVTTRLYTNPANGASRGICFVEYGAKQRDSVVPHDAKTEQQQQQQQPEETDDVVTLMKERIEESPFEGRYLTAMVYHLTNQNWVRGGRLPDLPTDPPPTATMRGGVVEAYGDEGFTVRCGAVLGLANTMTPSGVASMQSLRKRLRMEEAALAAGAEKGGEGGA